MNAKIETSVKIGGSFMTNKIEEIYDLKKGRNEIFFLPLKSFYQMTINAINPLRAELVQPFLKKTYRTHVRFTITNLSRI